MQQIRIEPGALDAIPLNELARFLAQHGLELVYKPDGLTVRAAVCRADGEGEGER